MDPTITRADSLVFSTIKEELLKNKYDGLEYLLKIITNNPEGCSDPLFIKRNVKRCIELITDARKYEAISEDLLLKTIQQFYELQIFENNSTLQENLTITCSDGKKVHLNHALLNLSCPVFCSAVKVNDNCTHYDSRCLLFIKHYLITGECLTLRPYSLLDLLDFYALASVYEWKTLALLCKKQINDFMFLVKREPELMTFYTKLKSLPIPEAEKTEFEFNALVVHLNQNDFNIENSFDNKHLNLSAKRMTILEKKGMYGEFLRSYITGFILSDEEDWAAALLFDFMPDERRQMMKEMILTIEQAVTYQPILKEILSLLSAVSLIKIKFPAGTSIDLKQVSWASLCQMIQSHSSAHILLEASHLLLKIFQYEYEELASMSPIQTTCKIDLMIKNPNNFTQGQLFSKHKWNLNENALQLHPLHHYVLTPL